MTDAVLSQVKSFFCVGIFSSIVSLGAASTSYALEWNVECQVFNEEENCVSIANVPVLNDDLTVDVIARKLDNDQVAVVFGLPLQVDLSEGVKIKSFDKFGVRLPITNCDTQGCLSAPLTTDLATISQSTGENDFLGEFVLLEAEALSMKALVALELFARTPFVFSFSFSGLLESFERE